MSNEEGYVLTNAGHTALAEAYWREKIAKEIEKQVESVTNGNGEAHSDNLFIGGLMAGASIARGKK